MGDIDLTPLIFKKVYDDHQRSRAFACPVGWPLGPDGAAVPEQVRGILSPDQRSKVWIGSGEQLRMSVETLLPNAQRETFQFPKESCWPVQQPYLLGLMEQFYRKDNGGREPAMMWSFPFCCTHNWVLKQFGAAPRGGPCSASQCPRKQTALLAFDEKGRDTVEVPLAGLRWALPRDHVDESSFVLVHRTVDGESQHEKEIVSFSCARQIGRGEIRPELELMHSYGIHLAQDERMFKSANGEPVGVIDVEILKVSRLVPLSPPPVDSALIYDLAIALDRKTSEVIWVAGRRDVFSAMHTGENGSIYMGFLGDLAPNPSIEVS